MLQIQEHDVQVVISHERSPDWIGAGAEHFRDDTMEVSFLVKKNASNNAVSKTNYISQAVTRKSFLSSPSRRRTHTGRNFFMRATRYTLTTCAGLLNMKIHMETARREDSVTQVRNSRARTKRQEVSCRGRDSRLEAQ